MSNQNYCQSNSKYSQLHTLRCELAEKGYAHVDAPIDYPVLATIKPTFNQMANHLAVDPSMQDALNGFVLQDLAKQPLQASLIEDDCEKAKALGCIVPSQLKDRRRQSSAERGHKTYIQVTYAGVCSMLKWAQMNGTYYYIPFFYELKKLFFPVEQAFKSIFGVEIWARHYIVIKLIRYEDSDWAFATPRHYDKSTVSLLMQSTDSFSRLRVAPPGTEEFARVNVVNNVWGLPTTSVLMAGLTSHHLFGEDVSALHRVEPLEQEEPRYSIIAFAVPYGVDLDALESMPTTM